MTTYCVTYKIDIEAVSHECAALEACCRMRAIDSHLPVLKVTPWKKTTDGVVPWLVPAEAKTIDCSNLVNGKKG